MTKLEKAREILKECKTSKDVYNKNIQGKLKSINIGVFCDIPHMCKHPRVKIYSLRMGKFHQHLGNKILL